MEESGTLYLPPPSSTLAGEVDALFYFIYYASLVLFIMVMSATAYFILKYRRRAGRGPQSTPSVWDTAIGRKRGKGFCRSRRSSGQFRYGFGG